MAQPWPLIVFLIALCALAIAGASLLRRCGLSHVGARTLGGALAGLIMSPSILGGIVPDAYRQHVLGGAAEHQARQSLVRRHTADLLAAEYARTAPEERARLRERHANELNQADNALVSAESQHQLPTRIAMCTTVVLVLLGTGAASVRTRDPRQGWAAPLSIGVWAAAFPGALAYAAGVWWWEFSPVQAGLLAAAVAIGPWGLTAVDVDAANHVEFGGARMVQTAGRIASIIAIVVVVYSIFVLSQSEQWWWSFVSIALPVGWMLEPLAMWAHSVHHQSNAGFMVFEEWLIPFLAALVAVQISLFDQFAFWPLLGVIVLSGDGRWLGAVIGAILPGGRNGLRAMRLVMGSMAAGPTQLAIAGIAGCYSNLGAPLLLPILAGSIFLDLTVPLRRKLSQELVQAESALSDDEP